MQYLKYFFFLFFLPWLIPTYSQEIPPYVFAERKKAEKRMPIARPDSQTGNYDWKYQRLELQVDPASTNLHGETLVYFSFFQDDDQMIMDLTHQLNVLSVTYHGQNIAYNQTSNDELIIHFPARIPASQTDSIRIVYEGTPANSGFDSYVIDTHNGMPVLWTLSEPYGAKDWWPCKQDLNDKLDSIDVILQYPANISGEEMVGVSNGVLVHETVNGGVKISHWKHRHAIPAYLVAIAVTNYRKYSHQAGIYRTFPIDNYVYPEDYSSAVTMTPVTVDIMNFFEDKYGEYTYSDEKYGHAQFGWGGGMEHTTISFMGGFSRGLIAHELAHQWFGDDVTCGSWSDIWLNEGFATYSEALTQEYFDGDYQFLLWRQYARNLIIQRPHGSVYVYGSDTLNVGRVFSWRLSYLKGAMVLHMLRFRLGDDKFFETLQTYRNAFHHNYAKTEDFKNIVEQVNGSDFTEFFNDWVYGKGFPEFYVEWETLENGTYRVKIRQTSSDPSVGFFETPLKLRFKSSLTNHSYDTIINLNQNNEIFYINANEEFDILEADPDFDIIRGNIQVEFKGAMDWDHREIIVFPNPSTDYIRILVRKSKKIKDLILFDATGKIIFDKIRPNYLVDIRNLAKGTYFVQMIYNNGQKQTYRFIKN